MSELPTEKTEAFVQSLELPRAQGEIALRLLIANVSAEEDIHRIYGERHAEYAVQIEEILRDPSLSEADREMWEGALKWQKEKQAERAYMIDPTLPRPEHLPAPMTDEEFAEAKAKVDSVKLR